MRGWKGILGTGNSLGLGTALAPAPVGVGAQGRPGAPVGVRAHQALSGMECVIGL